MSSSSDNEKLIGYVIICVSLIMIIHLMWSDDFFKLKSEHMGQLVASPVSTPESIPAPAVLTPVVLRSEKQLTAPPPPPPVIQAVPVIDTVKHLGFDDRISEPKTAGSLKMDVMLDTHVDATDAQIARAQQHMGRENYKLCEATENSMNDFVKFGDIVNLSSGQRTDLVDKITKVYLGDNVENARGFTGKRIGEVFDQLTKGPSNLPCIVPPQANVLLPNNSYKVEGFRGDMYTGDTWVYPNENMMNGGRVDNNLYPDDPMVEPFKII